MRPDEKTTILVIAAVTLVAAYILSNRPDSCAPLKGDDYMICWESKGGIDRNTGLEY